MAIVKCPECGRRISDKAKICPGCGYPMKKTSTFISAFLKGDFSKGDDEGEEEEDDDNIEEPDSKSGKEGKGKPEGCILQVVKWKYVIRSAVILLLILLGIQSIACFWHYEVDLPKTEAYQGYLLELTYANDQICRYDDALNEYNEKVDDMVVKNRALDKALEQAEAVLDSKKTLKDSEKVLALVNTVNAAKNDRIEIPERRDPVKTFNIDSSLEGGKIEDIKKAAMDLKQYSYLGISSEYTIRLMTKELSDVDYSDHIKSIEKQISDLDGNTIPE